MSDSEADACSPVQAEGADFNCQLSDDSESEFPQEEPSEPPYCIEPVACLPKNRQLGYLQDISSPRPSTSSGNFGQSSPRATYSPSAFTIDYSGHLTTAMQRFFQTQPQLSSPLDSLDDLQDGLRKFIKKHFPR